MSLPVRNILFLCTGNSARSILAEAIANKPGKPHFLAFSAGSQPAAKVNPDAIELLIDLGYATAKLRPKSWTEFALPGAPALDVAITVCDSVPAKPVRSGPAILYRLIGACPIRPPPGDALHGRHSRKLTGCSN